jgi:dolichol kinase
MFILANLDIIVIALLAAAPFYFFNRYLVKTMRPSETRKRLALYFISVSILALLYSFSFVIIWIKYKY